MKKIIKNTMLRFLRKMNCGYNTTRDLFCRESFNYKFILILLFFSNCLVPSREDVGHAAEVYLNQHFQQDFIVFNVKSTVNEGNMNFKGFNIIAAPKNQPGAIFTFDADYLDGKIVPRDNFIDKRYVAALARIEHSTRLVTSLKAYFNEFLAVFNPNIWDDAVMEIYFFRLPTEANKNDYFKSIASALSLYSPYPKAKKITINIAFFPKVDSEFPSDHLIDKYFAYKTGDATWIRNYIYSIQDELNPLALPDAVTLEKKLSVNFSATVIQTARFEIKKRLENNLQKEFPKERYNADTDGIKIDFADALHLLRFRFKACQHGKSMYKCPKGLYYYAVYNLETLDVNFFPRDPEDSKKK